MNKNRIPLKTITWLTIAVLVSAQLPFQIAEAASASLTYTPVADAYVTQERAGANFGTNPSLRVDASPVTRSYLRFDVKDINGRPVQSAKLRVYANSSSHDGYDLNLETNNSWSETKITYANAPAVGALLGRSGRFNGGKWTEVDVTKDIQQDGMYSLVMVSIDKTSINLAAREDRHGHAPQLVITLGGSNPTATPTEPTQPATPPAPTLTATPPTPPGVTPTATSTTPPPATPTASTTNTPAPGGDPQPSFPIRAAFYYPWFPEAWNQQGFDPFTNYHPTLGYYDSGSTAVIKNHVTAMQYANIQAGIASWWGQGSQTDGRIGTILAATAGSSFRWALYYENESQGDPSASQIQNDLTYIRDRYGKDPSYLRVNGKFVVFVYADGADGCGMADRWKQGNTVGAYIVLKVFPGYATCASQPDGWHQYAPAVATDAQGSYSFTISPGFWKKGDPSPRLARDLTRWNSNIQQMVASGAKFQLVTTFNEWGEGTSVESAQEWATSSGFGQYLDALHNNGRGSGAPLPTATSTSNPTAAPTTTPAPTLIPTQPSAGGDPLLVGAGDIAICGGGSASNSYAAKTANLIGQVISNNAGRTVHVATFGDNSNESGTVDQYNNCFDPTWGQFKSRMSPSEGNHDNMGGLNYFNYFGSIAGTSGKGWYSYDLGAWHIEVLTEYGNAVSTEQLNWLKSDLAAHTNKCTLAYWHAPRFSDGVVHGDTTAGGVLWDALYAAGADVVLAGHDHDYERFNLINPSGQLDLAKGMREFVVGTGGAGYRTGTGQVSVAKANSQFYFAGSNSTDLGVIELTLHSASYDWQFLTIGGKVLDAGATACH
ncbi:MAG: DNRLRE domain-containing protein [Chloroflexi bacterium]|nr:DNRLRE domain-containing protein [Chloroflexota bacterium]